LVNSNTFEITGIIDYETIEVVLEWKASRFPNFLSLQINFEEIDDKEPRIPALAEYDAEGDD